jgi:hypothetical protein
MRPQSAKNRGGMTSANSGAGSGNFQVNYASSGGIAPPGPGGV